jgi:hypothetical protein
MNESYALRQNRAAVRRNVSFYNLPRRGMDVARRPVPAGIFAAVEAFAATIETSGDRGVSGTAAERRKTLNYVQYF